jgi:DNA-directed RNA polymerase alpha subunit
MIDIKLGLDTNNFQEDVLTLDTNMTIKQANVFRRLLLSQVEVVAVDLMRVHTNDTIFPDEILASRVGQIPVRYDADLTNKNICECENFCDKCSIIVNYENTGKENGYIFSQDISPLFKENIIVAKVCNGQRIKFSLLLSKSTAHEHDKWSPRVVFQLSKGKKGFVIELTRQGCMTFSEVISQILPLFAIKVEDNIRVL